MFDLLRPFLSRLAGAVAGALAAWLVAKWNITLDADTIAGVQAVTLGAFAVIYSIVHRLIDKKINPVDAASAPIARREAKLVSPYQRSTS